MFDRGSRPTITESAVESADSISEVADSTADSATNPLKIGLWVWAFDLHQTQHFGVWTLVSIFDSLDCEIYMIWHVTTFFAIHIVQCTF